MAMLISLTPICGDDPAHTLFPVYLKCNTQNLLVYSQYMSTTAFLYC